MVMRGAYVRLVGGISETREGVGGDSGFGLSAP